MARRGWEDRYPTLGSALTVRTVPELSGLARLLGDEPPKRKDELITFVCKRMDEAGLRRQWGRLGPLEQSAVAEVVHGPGAALDLQQIRAKYGGSPQLGRLPWSARGKDVPGRLLLFFHGNGLVMPDDVKAALARVVPPPEAPTVASIDDVPAALSIPWETYDYQTKQRASGVVEEPVVRRDMETAARHDLLAVLRLVDSGEVRVSTKTSLPSAAAVRAVGAVLLGGDYYPDEAPADDGTDAALVLSLRGDPPGPIRAYSWPLLVQAAGLAERSGSRLQLTAAGRKALSAAPHQTLKTAWKRWLRTTMLDELRRVDVIKGQTGAGARSLVAVGRRREGLAAALAELPLGRWVEFGELARYLRAVDRDFTVARSPWSLYLVDAHYGALGYSADPWELIEGRYARCFLLEYAASLGIVDVAYVPPACGDTSWEDLWGTDDMVWFSRYDGLQYLRLTPLGAWCTGAADRYLPRPAEARSALRVLPTLEVVAPDPDPSDRLTLDAYGAQTSDAVWRLDLRGLLAAAERGLSTSALRDFLRSASGEELPASVGQLLADAEERSRALEPSVPALLIRCQDRALAVLIAGDRKTAPHCLLAGERHLAVPADSEAPFRRGLRELGYCLAAAGPER